MKNMILPVTVKDSNKGSALIVTLLILIAVTASGIVSSKMAMVETQIAGYDKFQRATWTVTDGTTDMLLPQVIEYTLDPVNARELPDQEALKDNEGMEFPTQDFFMNESQTCEANRPESDNRDVFVAGSGSSADISIRVYGDTEFTPGSALQLPEGYHGAGKGAAGGGTNIVYNIRGLGVNMGTVQARVQTRWRHVN